MEEIESWQISGHPTKLHVGDTLHFIEGDKHLTIEKILCASDMLGPYSVHFVFTDETWLSLPNVHRPFVNGKILVNGFKPKKELKELKIC